jgi:2-desacetyl-2-hydroxyethyl bacteriochlorophyllide A dehydrogenase
MAGSRRNEEGWTMKALVYTRPHEVQFREEAEPVAGPGEVLVKIDAVGICGSDMHAYHGHDPRRVPPLILGHEAAGRVLSGDTAGRRIILNPLITCGRCSACLGGRQNLCAARKLIGMNRPGAFAEMIAIPESNLIEIPADMDPAAAALAEPAATALHALHLVARALDRPIAEAKALVIGGGSVGLLAALFLKSYGAREIVLAETNRLRRDSAARTGACLAVDPTVDAARLPENKFDLVVDAVGGAVTRRLAIAGVRPGGVIVHIGLMDSVGEADFRKITLAELTFIGTYTYTPVDLRACVAALHAGRLGSLDWVERRRLADGAGAFADLDQGRTPAAKIVLLPS